MPIVVGAAALLGLAVGSFLTVVAYRLPRGESLVRPGSHCPHCAAPVRARHNVPVLGWLALRGRCAACAAPISARYPLTELATALLFVAIALQAAHGARPDLDALVLAGLAVVAGLLATTARSGARRPVRATSDGARA